MNPFEGKLLRILRFFLGYHPAEDGLRLLRESNPRPLCLSVHGVECVKDTLAKGIIQFLVRVGGWRRERYLVGGRPVQGRLWERASLEELRLSFSPVVLDFLMEVTAQDLRARRILLRWDSEQLRLTPADELFFWLTFRAVRRDPNIVSRFRSLMAFRANRYCWISFPTDIAQGEPNPPDFSPLFTGQRALILECLQRPLERLWRQSEENKQYIRDWEQMRIRGRAEFAALNRYLQAAEQAKRFDLGRFVLRVNAGLFSKHREDLSFWTGGLNAENSINKPGRLSEQLEVQRQALAFPRLMETLERWQTWARGVGYVDDDYAISQLWKSDWEQVNGDVVAARARDAIAMLDPLRRPTWDQGNDGDETN